MEGRSLPATLLPVHPGVVAAVAALAPTTTTVSLVPASVAPGQQVTVTASVRAPGGGIPTGTVAFGLFELNNGVPTSVGQGSAPLNSSGQATISFSQPTTGTFAVVAAYQGDANFAGSASQPAFEAILPPSATTVYLPSNPSVLGQPTPLVANVFGSLGGPAPTGTVTFVDGTTILGSAPITVDPATPSTGRAVFTTSTLGLGNHIINAVYQGDANYAPSASASTQEVQEVLTGVPAPPIAGGPRVTSLRRLGVHGRPTSLVLSFDGPLVPAPAQDLRNYSLIGPVGHAGSGRPIPIASAVYNATANTVTLTPVRPLDAHTNVRYRLTVHGTPPLGLSNPLGVFLDGVGNGQAGTDYVATFSGVGSSIIRSNPGIV